MKTQTFVSAKTTVNKMEHISHVTIDWAGMSEDDVQAMAQRSLIIRWQNNNRTKEVIPNERVTLKAVEYRLGTRLIAPVSLDKALDALSEEEAIKLLEERLARFANKKEVEEEVA